MTDQPTLSELSAAATQGEWWADHDPREGMEWNSHIMHGKGENRIAFMSNMGPGRIDETRANAAFIAALVNAFRAGTLVDVSDLASLVKPLVWEENRNDYWTAKGTGYQVAHNGDGTWRARLNGRVTHRRQPSFSKAKAAAEAHHVAHVLSMLNLPAKEDK